MTSRRKVIPLYPVLTARNFAAQLRGAQGTAIRSTSAMP